MANSKKLIITVSQQLYKQTQKLAKAKKVGVPEYIRYLIMKAAEGETYYG